MTEHLHLMAGNSSQGNEIFLNFVNTITRPEFCSRLNGVLSNPPYVPFREKPAASWRRR